jgi:BlaI family penicillinase repressor
MARRPSLSKAEMEVARIVWNLGRATVRQVFESFPPERNVNFTTVQTYLRRLQSKGYLRAKRQGRAMVYKPRVRFNEIVSETVGELVNRLFDGHTIPLLQHLIRDTSISKAEIRKLREMIDRLEGS